MQYYIKTDFDNKPVALFRFENTPEDFAQQVWLQVEKEWADSESLAEYLLNGEVFLFTATPEQSKVAFPEAFSKPEEKPVGIIPDEGEALFG
jgi:hypothetical protein